jgi:adenosylmethionine-8-amino-7-oxononanoate aminotransferase
MVKLFEEQRIVVRLSGDTLVLAPALIATEDHIAKITEGIRAVLKTLG